MADPKDLAAQLEAFNQIEAQGQPWYKKQLPMEGRATFLPFRDTMEGSVFNQRELAMPGVLASALNAFSSPERARTGSDTQFNPNEEAINFATNVMGGGVGTSAAMKAPMGQGGKDLAMNAYHGTPHEIKGNFDLSKVGTGEGAQAYGHGMYFAESPAVAQQYQKDISRSQLMKGGNPEQLDQMFNGQPLTKLYESMSTKADRMPYEKAAIEYEKMSFIEDLMQGTSFKDAISRVDDPAIAQWAKTLEQGYKPAGNLYKVDIPDAQIPMMLNYDTPIKDQPKIYELIKNSITDPDIRKTFETNAQSGISGANAYKNYLSGKTDAERSANAANLGITGIRYLDQGSRDVGKGSSNFVVFKPETVKILEKNDVPVNPIKDLSDKWNSKGVNLDVYASKDGTKINLSKISVDPKQRNQGIGSQVMNDIIQQADNTNAIVTLSPSVDFGGTSVARLKDFYKEFGFVENKGRNKDFSISETMYRKPVQTLPTRKELLQQEFDKLDK